MKPTVIMMKPSRQIFMISTFLEITEKTTIPIKAKAITAASITVVMLLSSFRVYFT